MNIRYFRSLWGAQLSSHEKNIAATREAGFDGVEYIALPDDAERLAFGKHIKTHDLDFILQLGTGAGTGPAIGQQTPTDHAQSLEREFLLGLDLDPLFANAHSGRDIFSPDDNLMVMEKGAELEVAHDLTLLHETHRGRATATLPTTLELIRRQPSLKLTADFSHWTCAHESMLQDQQEAMAEILPHVHHIHARVGNEQSPQVGDPRSAENKEALDTHLGWWKEVIRLRREAGAEEVTVTVEFGPPPYFSGDYTAEKLWEINCWMLDYLKKELAAV
jgi:sugar phosphate isomerase/epimerase